MATPGIGDPYWYEWYVGLEQIIRMINPDNDISYVIFQSEHYNTIDDVVVGYNDGHIEMCYQVKHEIQTSSKNNLTFKKLIETQKNGSNLITDLIKGWSNAKHNKESHIIPVFYTNRSFGSYHTSEKYGEIEYKAVSLSEFMDTVKKGLEIKAVNQDVIFDDELMTLQWCHFLAAINLEYNLIIEFLSQLIINKNMLSLEKLEQEMTSSLSSQFRCTFEQSQMLFERLVAKLRIWTTTRREQSKVTIEDVYDALCIDFDESSIQHLLPPPRPFFGSRNFFCTSVHEYLTQQYNPVVFLSGEPGMGKTSIVSYLQSEYNLFCIRYHTFRPISPEQRFYDADDGLCTQEALWGEMLVQIRKRLRNKLALYRVPINNALCNTQMLRNEVLRLLKVLHDETNQTIFVCIDGIDHAARSNREITFLSSLCQPNEVPNGVTFVIVGQPFELYPRYPLWLGEKSSGVVQIDIPKLEIHDIEQLILDKLPHFNKEATSIANLIFNKTKGNNLSVVFSVAEAQRCTSEEELANILDSQHMNGDINQYYGHIWNHITTVLASNNLMFSFPDAVIASVIILLNGRIDSFFLCNALPTYQLSIGDWNLLMDSLYPLIIPTKNQNEYSISHNDFRVFLMSITKRYQSKYKELALVIADYLIKSPSSLMKSINIIPLLICAGTPERIVDVYNTEFVIDSLSEGMSYEKFYEYSDLAYREACRQRNWGKYHNVSLAIQTLHQHFKYYEYFDRKYQSLDSSDVTSISVFEVKSKPLNQDTLYDYSEALDLALRLYDTNDPLMIDRSKALYYLWFDQLTPLDFVRNAKNDGDDGSLEQTIELIMPVWGRLAAKYKKQNFMIETEYSEVEKRALYGFNDAYFECLFLDGFYQEANDCLFTGMISYKCVSDHLFLIFEKNLGTKFLKLLNVFYLHSKEAVANLFSAAILLTANQKIDYSVLIEPNKVKYTSDELSFGIILYTFVYAYQNRTSDLYTLIGNSFSYINIEDNKDSHLKILIRVCAVIGKYYGRQIDSYEENDAKHLIHRFLTTRIIRSFEYTQAYKFILFLLLRSEFVNNNVDSYINDIEYNLFEINMLSTFYKTSILDFLIEHNLESIVKRYFDVLYGVDGQRLFENNEDYYDTHKHFESILAKVNHSLASNVSEKIKWDVVGYTNHKEYILHSPYELYMELSKRNPKVWNSLGLDLDSLSSYADLGGGNRLSIHIMEEISRSAIACSIKDFWELHLTNCEYQSGTYILRQQLFMLIDNFTSPEDILFIWVLACGILSWYNHEDRNDIRRLYQATVDGANETNSQSIISLMRKITPTHVSIANLSPQVEYDSNSTIINELELEKNKIELKYQELNQEAMIDNIANSLTQSHLWHKIETAWNIGKNKGTITPEIAQTYLELSLKALKDYSWTNQGCDQIFSELTRYLGVDFLWIMADYIGGYLDKYNYQTSTENMSYLIEMVSKANTEDVIFQYLKKEIHTQSLWITGNNHINVELHVQPMASNLPSPTSSLHLSLNILLEHFSTRNIHKIEIALFAIYTLGKLSRDTFTWLSTCWHNLDDMQKQFVLKACERWCKEDVCGFEILLKTLREEYDLCNQLDQKYLLYQIIKSYHIGKGEEYPQISYSQVSQEYQLPKHPNRLLDNNRKNIPYYFSVFLNMANKTDWRENSDIISYIEQIQSEPYREPDTHSRMGDSYLPIDNKHCVGNSVLYGEEKLGRWRYIPLIYKMQWLLNSDDAWVLTSPPIITTNEVWDIEGELEIAIKNGKLTSTKPSFDRIIYDGVSDDYLVLGACIWYPVKYRDGLIYKTYEKVVFDRDVIADNQIYQALMNYNLISNEDDYFEPVQEMIDANEICLVREIVGTTSFIYGNCFLVPSNYLKETFCWKPNQYNPYIWENNNNELCLKYERIAYPHRRTLQEQYFRQPILGRWLCHKNNLKIELKKNQLTLKNFSNLSNMKDIVPEYK